MTSSPLPSAGAGPAGSGPAVATVAAAVSYSPIGDLPEELAAIEVPDGVAASFYDLTSLDGRTGEAVYLRPDRVAPDAPLVLSIHGSGGHIAGALSLTISRGLASAGYPVLAINTRQSKGAVNTDNFYATVRDIEAAFWMARSLGHDRIVLHGHSLGTLQVSYYAATHWDGAIAGVVLTANFADLAWKSRHILIGDEERYQALRTEAVEAAKAADYGRTLAAPMPWLRSVETPVTAEHFLTYRTEGTAGSRSVDWAARIPYPILMVRDSNDTVIYPFEAQWMETAAAEGIAASVTRVTLESEAPSIGHGFEKSGGELIGTMADWLGKLGG